MNILPSFSQPSSYKKQRKIIEENYHMLVTKLIICWSPNTKKEIQTGLQQLEGE